MGIRTELAEMKDALLSDDCADQKSDQSDDRYRLPTDLMKVVIRDFKRSERCDRKTPKPAEASAASICRKTDISSTALNVARPTLSSNPTR